MLQLPIRHARVTGALLVAALGFGPAAEGIQASNIITLTGKYAAGFTADDYFTDQGSIGTFDVRSDRVVLWNAAGVQILNRITGALEESLGDVPQAYLDAHPEADIWNTFTTFDPSGDSVWVGFSHQGNLDDRIYHVVKHGQDNWQWTHKATLTGNVELVFYGGEAYASANPAAPSWGTEAGVYRVDTTAPGGAHDLIAHIGGYSAGLALDVLGNLYYGSFHLTADWQNSYGALYKFAAEDVAVGNLGTDDAVKLTDLPYGAADTEVDDAGLVMVALNAAGASGPNYVAAWDGQNTGSGDHYEMIATGTGDNGNFFVGLKTLGDFDRDGMLYINDGKWGEPYAGIAGIRVVPEPSTMVMILAAALCGALCGRRRRGKTEK